MEIVQSGHSSHIGGMHAIVEDSTKASSPILLHSETHQQTGDIKREGSKLSQTSNNSLQDWLREQTHSIGGARERGDSGETEEITDYSLDDSKMASINDRDSLKLAITCHDKGSKIEEDGRFEKAIEYHEKGLEIRIKVLGRNHFDTAISCARIASVHSKMGESGYDQALNYYHQALPVFLNGHYSDIDADADTFEITNGLQVRESTHSSSSSASNQSAAGINIHSAAGIYANIGSIHYRRGEYKYALEHYSMALSKLNQEISPKRTKNKSKFDKVKIDIAAVLNTIGTIHSKEIEIDGNGKEAISRYKQSLKIRETVLGKKHPETLATYNNIGSVHFNLSNVDSALKYFKRALPRTVGSRRGTVKAGRRLLDRQRSIFDKVDYDYAISKTYSNIGSVHFKKGNFERSLHYYSEALRLQYIEDEDSTSKSIDKQLSAATTYSNIASAYSKKGDFEDSLEFHVRALEIRETQLGDHVDTATSYYNIGFLHARHEDYDLALEAHRKSLDIRKNVLGENHKDVASSYNSVGISYFHLGYYTEAITSHLRAIKVEETVLGTTHSTTGMSYNNVGTAYYKNREHDLALQYYMKALLIKQEAIGPNHRDMYSLYSNIGATYWRKGDKDQAAIWFQKACNVNKERFEKDHYLSSNKFLDHISDSRERKREVEKGQPLRDAWSTGGNESNSGHSKKISENDVYTDGDVGGGIIVDLVDFPVSLEMGASTGDDVSVSSFQEDEMVSNSEELSSTFGGKNGEADIEDGSKTPKRSNTRTLRESATVLSTDNVADDFNDDAIKDSDMPDGLAKVLLAPVAAGAMLAKKVLNMNGDQCVSSDANDNADAINEDLVSSRAGADGSDMESEVENDLGPEEEGEEYVETFHEPETATDFLDDKGASSLDQDQAEDQYDKVNAALVALAVTAGMAGALLSSSLKDSEEDAEHAVSASQHEGTMVDTAMIARDSFSPRKPSSATNSAATALPVYDGDFEILGMQQDADQGSVAICNGNERFISSRGGVGGSAMESATVLSTDNVADDFNDDAIKDSDMPDGLAKVLLAPVAAGAMLAKKVLNMNGDQCVSSDANDNADAINEDLVSSRAGADGSDMESEVENDLGPEEEGEEYVETFHEPETATDFLDDKGASSLDQDQAEDQYDKVNAALVALAVTAGMAGALLSSSLKDSEEDAEHAVSASQHEGTMVDTAMIARDSFSPRKPSSATNSAATALPVYDGDFEILGMQQDADQDSDADINVTSSGLIASVKMHVVRSDKKGVVSRHSSMNHSFVEREGSEEANDFWMEEKEFVETSNKLEIATYILGVKDATADMDKPVVGSEEVEEGHDFRREEENNVPRFDQNEYIGFSGETSDFDALVTLGSDVLPEGNNSEPLSVSTKESLDDNGALRFDQNEYIGFSGETSDFDALVTLGSDGLPEASRDIDHDDKSSRVVNNSMRFDPIDYLGDSGDTSDYDALISVGSNGFPVTKSVRPKRASKFGKMSAKDAARLSHMGEANGLDASEDNASISSFHQYSAKYEELSETFAHLYQGDTVKRRRSKNASRGLHANESARAAYAKISRNAGIPSHRIRNDGRHLYGRDQNSNMHSSNNVPSRHRHGRDSKSSSYSHYAARKLDRSPSGRWRRKVANLTRQSLPSSQSTTAISVYDKLYQLSRLSGPGRTLKRSYMPNKSRFQRLYGYDRQKSHEYTRRRKHRMLPSIFMKLYEMSLQRQIEGKNRRLKIERELQMREAERRGDFARGHTPESGSLRLHRNRANQSRSNLQEELVKPKQKITIGEATELYNRLLYHKNQTKKKVEEVRKLRELRESEWQRSQRKEKIMLARLHSLYNRNTVASELRAENR